VHGLSTIVSITCSTLDFNRKHGIAHNPCSFQGLTTSVQILNTRIHFSVKDSRKMLPLQLSFSAGMILTKLVGFYSLENDQAFQKNLFWSILSVLCFISRSRLQIRFWTCKTIAVCAVDHFLQESNRQSLHRSYAISELVTLDSG
jgi:hypothetical protein